MHVVRQKEVGLRFDASFHKHHSRGAVFNVRFKLNRYPLRRQHQALDAAFAPERILFPTKAHLESEAFPSTSHIKPFVYNPQVAANEAQLQAVATIVEQEPGAVPYIIFGPYVDFSIPFAASM